MSEHLLSLIEENPKIMFGKPVVKGTRIPVDLILERLAYRNSYAEILESYPNLSSDSIDACLYYAMLHIRNEQIYSIAS